MMIINKTIKLGFFLLLVLTNIFLFTSCSDTEKPKIKLIFDTDFGGDADDLGALAMLNHFHNKGEIEFLAVMCWNLEQHAVSAIDAVNLYYGNKYIPVGRRAGAAHKTPWNHSKVIADHLPYDLTIDRVPETTILYRQLLNDSEDHSLVIVAVGPLMNIKNLIDSPADEYSEMTGTELINSKVKEFVIMGGNFPESKNEWNFDGNMPGVTKYVLEHLESPITFSGAELGAGLKTGEVFNELDKDSPLYLGFLHFGQYAPWMKQNFEGKIFDNSTFDQTAVLYAVRNGIGQYWHKVSNGKCVADSTGGNAWVSASDSNHSYLVLDMDKEAMETELEKFMLGEF